MVSRRSFMMAATIGTMGSELGKFGSFMGYRGSAASLSTSTVAVVDRRLSQARHFAAVAESEGVPVLSFDGDAMRLWRSTLAPHLRDNPTALVGLSNRGNLFCLERLAWDYGSHVSLRVDHLSNSQGAVAHVASDGCDIDCRDLLAAGREFGGAAARQALAYRHVESDCSHADVPAVASDHAEWSADMVTWIIKPRNSRNSSGRTV